MIERIAYLFSKKKKNVIIPGRRVKVTESPKTSITNSEA